MRDSNLPYNIHVGEKYRHFKGGIIQVVSKGLHTETLEELIVYQHVNRPDGNVWIRPASMFYDEVVTSTGGKTTRFVPIKERVYG